MADEPEKSGSQWLSPGNVVAIVGAVATLLAAVIGVLPNLLGRDEPAAIVPIVVTATPQPPTATPEMPTATPQPPTATPEPPTATPEPPTTTPEPPTATPEPPTATPQPAAAPNVVLYYDDVSFTVRNISGGTLSLAGVRLEGGSAAWDASMWGARVHDRLPNGQCLRLRDATVGQRQPPQPCVNNIFGLMEVGRGAIFWRGGSFSVLQNGAILATCALEAGECAVYVPQG
jgi:hypothetical protein